MQRYMQQLLVPEIGSAGQASLAAAKVFIIGAGGLGSPLAMYLSAAGVGQLGIADGDTVSSSNLSRQFLYTDQHIGQLKAPLLAQILSAQNPATNINSCAEFLSEANIEATLAGYDIMCDCTDNAAARILLDQFCQRTQKPLVYAAVMGWQGQVTVLHHRKKTGLEQIFSYEALQQNEQQNCTMAGIVNAACGIAASVQTSEVMKIILGIPSELDGGILTFDALGPGFRVFGLR